ncbi:MAG: phosphotransferase family protein, partial [Alphaproteobacteria bacterium]
VVRYRRYLDALGVPHPALEWGLRWCEVHAPDPDEVVLVHQDFRTGNYMVDEHGLSAILDWEFSGWGDPMSDIGWFCARCWRFGNETLEAGGIAPRAPFYRGYERQSGRRIDPVRVAYWEVMAHIRWAVIALQQGARTTAGGEASLELALTGRIYPPQLELEVLAMTPPARWKAA